MEEEFEDASLALISLRVLEEGRSIGMFYRERSMSREDSGWRFFAGDEDGAFIANPENMVCKLLEEIAADTPAIKSFLESEVGTAFDKDDSGEFQDVTGLQKYME